MTPNHDLQEKAIVVTGATSGLGLASVRALADRGALVIGVGRSPARCARVQSELRAEAESDRVHLLAADLSLQRQVRDLAEAIRSHPGVAASGRLDVLINNAATVSSWYAATENGYELQFAVNHLAPFLLTHLLLDILKASAPSRIINVCSESDSLATPFFFA